MYQKWDYTAVEIKSIDNYFHLYYNGRSFFFSPRDFKEHDVPVFSLRFILDMWFKEVKEEENFATKMINNQIKQVNDFTKILFPNL